MKETKGGIDLLVKNANATERTAGPLCQVCFKIWVEGLKKWSYKGDFELWADK